MFFINNYYKLALAGLLPVIVGSGLYVLDKTYKDKKKLTYWPKMIFIGVVFGLIAISATEFGIKINGYTMNARDASPVIAALLFDWPAGIIAGFIGGIERYFAAYWGAGTYTQWACTLGTICAGLLGASFKRYVLDSHTPRVAYGFLAGAVAEIIHMLLVFITHYDDPIRAFEVVRGTAIPMISVCCVSCGIAVIVARLVKYNGKLNPPKDNRKVSISQLFQRKIVLVVIVSFLITNSFNLFLQYTSAIRSVNEQLNLAISDASLDVQGKADSGLLYTTTKVANQINNVEDIDNEYLKDLCDVYEVAEVNVIDEKGIIIYSTVPDYLGYDMNSGIQSSKFLILLGDTGINSFVQVLQSTSYDYTVMNKYAGVRLDRGGFVQVAYNLDMYHKAIKTEIQSVAINRRVGSNGHLVICEEDGTVLSDYYGVENAKDIGFDVQSVELNKVLRANVYGDEYFYTCSYVEGYYIFAAIPTNEALLTEYMSIYLTTLMEIVAYCCLFIMVFFLIKKKIIDDVEKVNNSLQEITNGNLDTELNIRDSKEFNSLSDGINNTVNRLKELIGEAEKRMQEELEYAAAIQRSALPSNFPNNANYELYASMDPAKEVGGDFYDFFEVGDNKIGIVIADVSGKGVPASLFMMRAKSTIKSYAQYGISVNDVFTNANFNLCEGNDAGLFVTAWMGVLDLSTGHMNFVNAGHNPPLIKHPNGKFEYLKSRAGFVLGGMEGVVYKLQEIDLEVGSEIFVYTDGLTEAQNIDKTLYSEDRLEKSINAIEFTTSEDLCVQVKKDVDAFVDIADQFDDLTMLHLKYKSKR